MVGEEKPLDLYELEAIAKEKWSKHSKTIERIWIEATQLNID